MDLKKFVSRNEADLAPRLQAKWRQLGYGDIGGSTQSSNAPAKTDGPTSRRQMVAESARIAPSYRTTRSSSPALSAASRHLQGQNGRMLPPLHPGSGLRVKARSTSEQGSVDDMFGTDIENADATTISDLGMDDTSQSWNHPYQAKATHSVAHSQDGSQYEESLAPGPDDEQYPRLRPTSTSPIEQGMQEDLSGDEGSLDQASDEDQSQYGRVMNSDAKLEIMPEEQSRAPFAHMSQTPNAKNELAQPIMESPSTKKALAVRIRGQKMPQPKPASTVEPLISAKQQDEATFGVQNAQQEYEAYPPKAARNEMIKAISRDNLKPRSQQSHLNGMEERPAELLRLFERQNTRQDITAKPSPTAQFTESGPLPAPSRQQPLKDEASEFKEPRSSSENGGQHIPRGAVAPQEDFAKLEQPGINAQQRYPNMPAATSTRDQRVNGNAKRPATEDQGQDEVSGPETGQEMEDNPAKPQAKKPESRKRALGLDYTPEELSGMPYKLLHSESFDHIPKHGTGIIPNDIAKASLPEKLKYAQELKGREDSEAQRKAVFASLTIEQYEETGDLIIEQFSNILGRYKDARRAKREAAWEFEKEIGQREERVRGKFTAVNQDLDRLRRGAEDVVRGSPEKRS